MLAAVTVPRRATPYPYDRWPRLGRREARLVSRWLSTTPLVSHEAAQLAAELLGAAPSVHPGVPELVSVGASAAPGPVCIHLEPNGIDAAAPAVLDLDVATAHALVDRLLGGDGRPADADPMHVDELSRGVLGYLAARLLAVAPAAYAVAQVTLREEAGPLVSAPRLCWPLRLCVGELEGRLRLWLPTAALESGAPTLRAPTLGETLAGLPLTLVAHAGHLASTRDELASLAPGDALLLDDGRLTRAADGFEGELDLHLAGARRTRYRARLSRRELTLVGVDTSEEPIMGRGEHDGATGEEALRLAGDAPVELCVELARFVLPLEELAGLQAGQVLCTGRAIGEQVTLRAGGRAVARGELVEVEGEIGVRLTHIGEPR